MPSPRQCDNQGFRSLEEVAQMTGLTVQRVQQAEKSALKKINAACADLMDRMEQGDIIAALKGVRRSYQG